MQEPVVRPLLLQMCAQPVHLSQQRFAAAEKASHCALYCAHSAVLCERGVCSEESLSQGVSLCASNESEEESVCV